MRRFLLITSLIMLASIVQAKDYNQQFATYGLGNSSCGEYMDAMQQGGEQENLYRSWFAGYVTAFNLIVSDTFDIYGSTDFNGMIDWLNNYCQKFPNSNMTNSIARFTEVVHPYRVVYKQEPEASPEK